MAHRWLERALLALIVVMYLLLGTLYATRTPSWQAPDEPAHTNAIRQIAEDGCCPVIEMGDWQNAYQNALISRRFPPEMLDELATLEYQDHQPALYYLLAAPVYALTGGDLSALRLLSVLLGLLYVLLVYRIGVTVFPARRHLALAVTALVAFLPMHVAVMAAVTNDTLSQVMIALITLLTLRYLRGGAVPAWALGVLMGVGFWTKTFVYLYAAVIPLAIFLRWRREARPLGELVRAWGLYLLPALLIGGLWWGRNLSVYGVPDFLGLGAHDAVVVGQLRTAERVAEVGLLSHLWSGIQTTFNSFWGQFGWMELPMEGRMYRVLQVLSGAGLLGLLLHTVGPSRQSAPEGANPPAVQRHIGWTLLAALTLTVLMYLYFNATFVQFQGRYLFPGLIPIALGLALGVDFWRRLLLGRFAWSVWLTPLTFFPLAFFAWWMLTRYIVNLLPR